VNSNSQPYATFIDEVTTTAGDNNNAPSSEDGAASGEEGGAKIGIDASGSGDGGGGGDGVTDGSGGFFRGHRRRLRRVVSRLWRREAEGEAAAAHSGGGGGGGGGASGANGRNQSQSQSDAAAARHSTKLSTKDALVWLAHLMFDEDCALPDLRDGCEAAGRAVGRTCTFDSP
jgi:hypothetical protein